MSREEARTREVTVEKDTRERIAGVGVEGVKGIEVRVGVMLLTQVEVEKETKEEAMNTDVVTTTTTTTLMEGDQVRTFDP